MKEGTLTLFVLLLALLAISCTDDTSSAGDKDNAYTVIHAEPTVDGSLKPAPASASESIPESPVRTTAAIETESAEPQPTAEPVVVPEPTAEPITASTPATPEPEPTAEPLATSTPVAVEKPEITTETVGAGVARKTLPLGVSTLEERILRSDLIARVRLQSVTASHRTYESVVFEGTTYYFSAAHFTFEVKEVLHGTASGPIVVQARLRQYPPDHDNPRPQSPAEAVTDAQNWIDNQRDTQYDSRDAIVFLRTIANSVSIRVDGGIPSEVGYVFTERYDHLDGMIAGTGEDDGITIGSATNKVWLPASTASTTSTFLLDEPTTSAPSPPTITLANLKTRVTTELATVDPSIEGHKECLLRKHATERVRIARNWETTVTGAVLDIGLSGRPANTTVLPFIFANEVIEGQLVHRHYSSYRVTGSDAGRFTFAVSDDDTDPKNGYKIVVKQNRPLPLGDYELATLLQRGDLKTCGYTIPETIIYTLRMRAPEGTLHELFFDPVTVDTTVAADASNGVLRPASFTASNGASATIESISYESGTVRVKVVPWSELSGQILDFIELDGRVSLSLSVTNSTVHTADDVFAWSVGSQPWEDGDKLMVRIRQGVAAIASPPARVTAAASGGESVNLSWDAGRGAAGYQVQRRESGMETWEMEDDSVTERSYVVSGLSCETSYDFRVGAYGDGRRYEAEVKSWSAPVTETTGACSQPPTFDSASYSFEVSEDAVAGTQVGTVSATDPDAGDTVTYSITSGNDDGKFGIGGSTGVITVTSGLDYDTASSYSLEVQADDGRGGSATVTASISVIEVVVEGNAPVFGASSYSFSVVESASVGSTVGAVEATDADDGDTVTYSISSGNDVGKFGIDGTSGRITLAGGLDHATVSSYTLGVEASDGKGGKDSATVTVAVELAACSNGTAVVNPSEKADMVKDCVTLLSLRDALEGTAVLNWRADVPIGRWRGIGVSGRVVSLQLLDAGLDGTVPAGIGKLSGLKRLDLSTNELTGGIPSELGGLGALGWLTLDENRLTGSVPSSLGSLSNLVSLSIADNGLSGAIPGSLGNLSRLLYFSLGGNDLRGSIPTELGSIAGLQILYLDTNDLTGGIPVELARLTKLEILSLYGNKLSGGIPSELGNLSKLEELMLSRNGLTGSIPSSLERLSKLVYLRLSGNRLTGCIPAGLRNVADNDLGRLSLAYCAVEA